MANDENKTKTRPKIDEINFEEPVFITVRQASSRNIFEVFTGPDAKALAIASASELSGKNKTHVAVMGPQCNLFAPPPPVCVQQVQLDWTDSEND